MLKANERRQCRAKRSPKVVKSRDDVYQPEIAADIKKGFELKKRSGKYSSSTQVGNRL